MKRLATIPALVLLPLLIWSAGITTQMQSVAARRAAPAFVGPLDSYTTDLTAALSVARRLLSSYTGSLIRIRWDGGSAGEANIGYDASGNLDEAAIASNVGSNNAYLTTVYDQSGNGKDLVQTTSGQQPIIVVTGTLQENLSIPTGLWQTSRDCYMTTNGTVAGKLFVISTKFSSPNAYEGLLTSATHYASILNDPPTTFFGSSFSGATRWTDAANEADSSADTNTHVYSIAYPTGATDTWLIGTDRLIGGRYLDGPVTEFLIYSSIPAFQHAAETVLMDLLGL